MPLPYGLGRWVFRSFRTVLHRQVAGRSRMVTPVGATIGRPAGNVSFFHYFRRGTMSLSQIQEFGGIHRLVIAGDAEVDMVPQGGFQQRRGADAADGLSQLHRIPRCYG